VFRLPPIFVTNEAPSIGQDGSRKAAVIDTYYNVYVLRSSLKKFDFDLVLNIFEDDLIRLHGRQRYNQLLIRHSRPSRYLTISNLLPPLSSHGALTKTVHSCYTTVRGSIPSKRQRP
jgi:hypothetical protein